MLIQEAGSSLTSLISGDRHSLWWRQTVGPQLPWQLPQAASTDELTLNEQILIFIRNVTALVLSQTLLKKMSYSCQYHALG